jgi:hypothetical protein
MSHSECPHEPFSCDNSIFFEESNKDKGKIKRWVECAEYCKVKKWWIVDKYFMVEYEVWVANETGKICNKNPADWWEVFKGLKGGYNDMG